MRWVLLLLLAANLAMLGWWQGWFADRTPPQELQPQRLRVVPLGRLGSPSPTPLRQATPEVSRPEGSRPQPTSPASQLPPATAERNANDGGVDGRP